MTTNNLKKRFNGIMFEYYSKGYEDGYAAAHDIYCGEVKMVIPKGWTRGAQWSKKQIKAMGKRKPPTMNMIKIRKEFYGKEKT